MFIIFSTEKKGKNSKETVVIIIKESVLNQILDHPFIEALG